VKAYDGKEVGMLNPMDLSERTVLVTGASSGIGREISILLSRLGARLVLVARNADRLAQTVTLLEGGGHRVEPVDLTLIDEIPSWLKKLAAQIGTLDGLVHSAGIQITGPLRDLSSENVDRVMRINFGAGLGLARGFRQKGVCNRNSSIVFLSSVMGFVGQAGISVYAASKGALIALTKSLAIELAREGIRVNCVAPAYVKAGIGNELERLLTPEQLAAIEAMHPLGRGTSLEVAYAVAFLLAPTGRWITGSTLVVDGGYSAH
jgi:NAD(P)-dependent dehydrogenase (short-subunit alcohol dehydrogenase family)